eukprot:TRINITY_DN10084_c0_g1_i2.p1 TRINITY_DN10084_c0_g1~~TRINITY_DN10084_c0_g1_i2.p1  ORF type:complete len:691 (-),score=208.72 TRINITY_DN10084_c0_g1_i2:4-2076(-)
METPVVPKPIAKILIANRGEISCRIVRSCRQLGIASVAVFSDSDRLALHVTQADEAIHIGASESNESYLNIDRIVAAAQSAHADAIHPGYGFLSENADFAAACERAGITFIGPLSHVIRQLGSKKLAKEMLGRDASVPLVPGYNGADQSNAVLEAHAKQIGFPVLFKAAAGGGGRGMRVARSAAEVLEALEAARTEALSAFGDGELLVERYMENVRHIEFQIFGDRHGTVIHLGERECSLQRRHQKVVEEAPSVAVSESLRAAMGRAAVRIGKLAGYVGAGTVEFIVDAAGRFYFLEVNTRLQVEHPVTEMITGLDLVRLQIEIAQGRSLQSLGLAGTESEPCPRPLRGCSVEVRLCAEDPANNFMPSTGAVLLWRPAQLADGNVRFDTGIRTGSEVSIYYDAMLCKIISWGETRAEALARLVHALRGTVALGVRTNQAFLEQLLTHPLFVSGQFDTHFIERHCPPVASSTDVDLPAEILIAALLCVWKVRADARKSSLSHGLRHVPSGWRNNPSRLQRETFECDNGRQVDIDYSVSESPRQTSFTVVVAAIVGRYEVVLEPETSIAAGTLVCTIGSTRRVYSVAARGERVYVHSFGFGQHALRLLPRLPLRAGQVADEPKGYTAQMPGKVIKVAVADGQAVSKGELLLVLESMKIATNFNALVDGVASIRVKPGDVVEAGAVLCDVKPS